MISYYSNEIIFFKDEPVADTVTPLYCDDRSFVNAMQYVARKDTKEYYSNYFEAHKLAHDLANSFNTYIYLKELELKKEAKYFNEIEKANTIKEFDKIRKMADKMLKGGI